MPSWNFDAGVVESWTDIVQVAAGEVHVLGLKSDGTVLAHGVNHNDQCNVAGWTGIVEIDARWHLSLGLTSTKTVRIAGRSLSEALILYFNPNRDTEISNIEYVQGIKAVSLGQYHVAAILEDGSCVAFGYNPDGRCNVEGWTDIVAIDAGGRATLGLKSDGTVVAAGPNNFHQNEVSGWTDIVEICAANYWSLGRKSDGTVVAAGYCEDLLDGECSEVFGAWDLSDEE